jgi:peptidoglycan hydrolase-like protein with peptidoglycan-binding domain
MPLHDRPALTARVGPPPGLRERRPAQHAEPSRLPQVATAASVLAAGGALAIVTAQPAAAASRGERAVAYAAQEKGSPYQWGAEGPTAFDCSGLVQFVYKRLGVALPRTAALQAKAVTRVTGKQLRKGDVVFFYDKTGRVFHNGIYAGGGWYWNAPETGKTVSLRRVTGTRWIAGRPKAVPVARPLVLKVGSRGPVVVAIQRKLRIPADGAYGPATAAAVKRFQKAHRLFADGEAGPATRARLFPPPKRVAIPAGAPLLRVGSRGPAVKALQRLLWMPADGEFGPGTKAGVIRFQRSQRLLADGEVGPRTWKAIQRVASRAR